MIVASKNSNVDDYQATEKGKINVNYSKYANAQNYAMTMELIKNAAFYNEQISVRAYAQLKDGRYVYSDIRKITVYDIADTLYQNDMMTNASGHNYLYDNILKIANPNYISREFNTKNIFVK